MTFVFMLLCFTVVCLESQAELLGHLQQLGKQWGEPTINTPELEIVPQPTEFYERFVKPRRPVVFRGAALQSPAATLWTPEYLAEEYGDFVVRLEARSEADGFLPATEVGFGRDTLRHFALNFQQMNAYVISQIPSPMEKDVFIPPCLACGNFARSIQEVHLFITARGGKTVLHRDPYSNIHCVFNGTKDWILIGNEYEHLIYQSNESVDEFGGFSTIDVDSVDLHKFPKISDVRHSFVTLNSGDCIFMPASYWHQVRVNGEYNTAVSIWFSRDMPVVPQDWSDCTNPAYDYKPMSEAAVLWRFSGGNESLNQGHMDIHIFRALLLSQADSNHVIRLDDFANQFVDAQNDNASKKREKLIEALGMGELYVTADYVRGLTSEQLKSVIETIDPTDVSNTEDFEYSAIEAKQIEALALALLERNLDEFGRHDFVTAYTSALGGTKVFGNRIFDVLDVRRKGRVSKSEFRDRVWEALKNYTSAPQHDPSSERAWVRHLRQRDEL